MAKITNAMPLEGERFEVDGHEAFLIEPESPAAKEAMPWLWYAPTLLPKLPDELEAWMFRRLLAAGMAIAGIDVGESYGSPAGRAGFSGLHHRLVDERGYARRPCLLARSRGGMMHFNWAAENPELVACIACIYPVCDLQSFPGLERASASYGISAQQLATVLAQHNPIDRLAPLAEANVPIFHIHGDQDEGVPLEDNSAVVAKRYRKAGGSMTLIVCEGQGHSGWEGYFQCQEMIDFILAHAI
ncbi:MAG: alpha/beta hydrolase [Phycisphaeraceae bacterium]|nr:alpha/beta hydrolase [Phycisphaeraceae bacterium]